MTDTLDPIDPVDPILIDVPEQIESERLLIRAPRPGDGPMVNAAIAESIPELRPWMPWAQEVPSLEHSETFARNAAIRFASREDLTMLLLRRDTGEFVGASGLHRMDWKLRSFEVGYWCRTSCTGNGYIAEAVRRLALLAFETFSARRFEARMDSLNERSWRVVERLGFTFEGTLRQDSLAPSGEPRDSRVYSILKLDDLDPSPP